MSAIVLEIVLTCVGCLYCGKNPSFHIEYAWQAFLYQSQSDGPRRCQYHVRLIRCQQTVVTDGKRRLYSPISYETLFGRVRYKQTSTSNFMQLPTGYTTFLGR